MEWLTQNALGHNSPGHVVETELMFERFDESFC